MSSIRFYVGTFTHAGNDPVGRDEGIYLCNFDTESGKISKLWASRGVINPAFLTLSADRKFLYSVNETHVFQGQPGGGVSAFSIDPASGELTFLNSQLSYGESPCFVSLDRSGKWLLLANYSGGNITVYPVLPEGSLGPKSEFIQHEGHGPNAERQEKAHAHSIQMDPTNRLALAADLGLDQVKLYELDLAVGKLKPHQPAAVQIHPAAGPRHLDFHPNGRWVYILNELDSTLVCADYSADQGTFRIMQTVSCLPEGYSGEKWAADVHVHPNGRFVYSSNRGHDSLAVFAIDPADGRVRLEQVISSGGAVPRNFAIEPGGEWLIAANQRGDNLVVYKINQQTGQLTPNGETLAVPAPVCVKFM